MRYCGKKLLCGVLTLALLLSLVIVPVSADAAGIPDGAVISETIDPAASDAGILKISHTAVSDWFSSQLEGNATKIYTALERMFSTGMMEDGRTEFDLAGSGISGSADEFETVSQADIVAYVNGDHTLFNDFAAAKDAFDIQHPEAWYVDSSYLTFRVAVDVNDRYHAYMGIGRGDHYYVSGVSGAEDVREKSQALQQVISEIETSVKARADRDNNVEGLSDTDRTVSLIKYAHDEIVKRISYRYETDCAEGNGGFIRTTYALVTHEGVCESYVRSLQWVLTDLGVPCVPIHGMQISGDQGEPHMWAAVQVAGVWYAVDITWDDPVGVDANGQINNKNANGVDGGENHSYFMVGKDIIGRDWIPSGALSTGEMEFTYPEISERSYLGDVVYDANGLNVTYSAVGEMEGAAAGSFTLNFNGMNMMEAAKEGYYMLIRMNKTDNATGKVMRLFDWYYLASVPVLYEGNPYVGDRDDGFHCSVLAADYLEFAITSRAPDAWDPDNFDVYKNSVIQDPYNAPYYHGNGTDIVCETGLLYNVASDYHAPPYIKNIYPAVTQQLDCTVTYQAHVEFDNVMYKPNQADVDSKRNEYLYDSATCSATSL